MIPIQNVYYMLSYAFRVLNEQGYKSIETEEFHNVAELCASILCKGVSLQLKRGLGKEYIGVFLKQVAGGEFQSLDIERRCSFCNSHGSSSGAFPASFGLLPSPAPKSGHIDFPTPVWHLRYQGASDAA